MRRRLAFAALAVLAPAMALAQVKGQEPPRGGLQEQFGIGRPPTVVDSAPPECPPGGRLPTLAAPKDCVPPPVDRPGNGDWVIRLPQVIVDILRLAPVPADPPRVRQPGGPSGPALVGTSGPTSIAPPTFVRPPSPPPFGGAAAVAGAFVPDEVLALVTGGPADVAAVAAAFGLEVRSQRVSTLLGGALVRFGIPDGRPVSAVLAAMAADPRVSEREPNRIVTLQQQVQMQAPLPQYALRKVALDRFPPEDAGRGVRVAVIDTAVDGDHPSLRGAIAATFNAIPGVPLRQSAHGTAVAGLVAGRGLLKGAAPAATILAARAFDGPAAAGMTSTTDAIVASLDWALEQEARVVNMSFAGGRDRLIGLACAAARARGATLIAAVGNAGPTAPPSYPAAEPGVVGVTGIDADSRILPLANQGAYVMFAAPGVDVAAPVPGGTDLVTGTSFAAALVSGVAAVVTARHPHLPPDLVAERLAATAVDLGAPGRDPVFGVGLVNAAAAADLR